MIKSQKHEDDSMVEMVKHKQSKKSVNGGQRYSGWKLWLHISTLRHIRQAPRASDGSVSTQCGAAQVSSALGAHSQHLPVRLATLSVSMSARRSVKPVTCYSITNRQSNEFRK
ncbi:MAG TPA: hypothetical protein ENN84_09250 [Candidatus Marinimicrobia bacterium]|nr:hypothetical protein [Candidatus Neomarinimicrobiota bacterium]